MVANFRRQREVPCPFNADTLLPHRILSGKQMQPKQNQQSES